MKNNIVYKALMVREKTHLQIIVRAKINKITVDQYINNLIKKSLEDYEYIDAEQDFSGVTNEDR